MNQLADFLEWLFDEGMVEQCSSKSSSTQYLRIDEYALEVDDVGQRSSTSGRDVWRQPAQAGQWFRPVFLLWDSSRTNPRLGAPSV